MYRLCLSKIGQANSLFIYTDSQSAVKATMAQSRESYHNETITKIWENTNFHKYNQSVPALCKNCLRHRFLQLKKTTRKGASKVLQLKTNHRMLNSSKKEI